MKMPGLPARRKRKTKGYIQPKVEDKEQAAG